MNINFMGSTLYLATIYLSNFSFASCFFSLDTSSSSLSEALRNVLTSCR